MSIYKAWQEVSEPFDYVNKPDGICQVNSLHDAMIFFKDLYGKGITTRLMEIHFCANAGCLMWPTENLRYIIAKVS